MNPEATLSPAGADEASDGIEADFLRSADGFPSWLLERHGLASELPVGSPDGEETEPRITRLRTRFGCC
jgi:hypothetical protein